MLAYGGKKQFIDIPRDSTLKSKFKQAHNLLNFLLRIHAEKFFTLLQTFKYSIIILRNFVAFLDRILIKIRFLYSSSKIIKKTVIKTYSSPI